MESYIHELASLYALGALDGAELTAFEKHLAEGCAECEAEVASFRATSGELAEMCVAAPPPDLRRKVLKSVKRPPQAPGVLFDFAGLLLSRPDDMPWQELAPGIWNRPLFTDKNRGYVTNLIRMAAGASFPAHKHNDTEELFLLTGDLNVAGVSMRAGDYCRAEPGSKHPDTHTLGGCTFLLMSSDHDELLVA